MTVLAMTAARRARPADLPSARGLLRAAGLPLDGLEDHFDGFWAVDTVDGELAGLAGAERYGPTWLLRSLVVTPGFRGRGIATKLLATVLGEARRLGARQIFLLTTDPQDYFAARGFIAVARSAGPSALLASEELRGACPDTATLMRLEVAR